MIKNQHISLNHSIVQGKGNIVSDMDTEKVMLSINNGKYYNLGEVGGKIWDLIGVPISVNQLVTNLISEYDVKQNECEQQVISFLERLLQEDLIHIE
ncbi:MAG: lasso peptide biosynthesis PqqD family chaperone [Carboxydocellales bacterium]